MNLTVYQNIVIHTLRIEGISDSSVLQIGSAGIIKPTSQTFNTGGFTQPAPPAGPQPIELEESDIPQAYVPLVTPAR